MGSQTTELEEAAQLYLAVLSRRNHQHLQILHVKLLTRRPVEVLGSLCLLRKNTHGWQWQLMNSFLEANIDFIFELQGDLGKLRLLRAC